MTVFKGYMILLKRNMAMTILYLCIFFGLTLFMGEMQSEKSEKEYAAEKINVAVVDEDGSELSEAIRTYIKDNHNLITIDNSEGAIQDALFYRYAEYVLKIPKGYGDTFDGGSEKLQTVKVPGSEQGQYLDAQINTFLNCISVYQKSGYTVKEAVTHALEQNKKSGEVTMIDQNGNGGTMERYVYMFQYFPYMIIAVMGYSMSAVLMLFRKQEVRMRMQCSSVSVNRQNLAGMCAFTIAGIGIWAFTMAVLFILYGKNFLQSPNKAYYLANSLLMLFAALAIAFLLGVVIKKSQVLTGAVNTLSLGMSFICGVFVPLEIIGGGVKKAAQFLPVYWYEVINNMLGKYNVLNSTMKETLWKGYAIQFAFAAACVCVGLMISRMQRQENS